MVVFKHPFQMLRHPTGIPFHQQAYPIPDPLQRHTTTDQRDVISSNYATANSLALGRFLGTDWRQTNQPMFLGANDRIAFPGQAQW
jgi:hypothetical protein